MQVSGDIFRRLVEIAANFLLTTAQVVVSWAQLSYQPNCIDIDGCRRNQ